MKNFKQFLLQEYISNDVIYLKKYLSQSEEERKRDLPYSFSYFFPRFVEEKDIDIDEDIDEMEPDILEEKNPEIFKQFGDYLYDKVESGYDFDGLQQDRPSWVFFDRPVLLKNQWLVHFTDHAWDIARNGFTIGVSNMERLGLTTYLSDFDKKYGGYNFAYTVADFNRYAWDGSSPKYGKEAILFQAAGIKTYHNGDEEPQVIFWGKLARNIIPIVESEEKDGGWTVFNKKTDSPLFQNEELKNVVQWVIKHFDQYRKVLV